MHKYSSVNNPDRHSFEPLTMSKIEARVKVITALSSRFFMDEDFPYSLSQGVPGDLVSLPLLFFFFPPFFSIADV